MVRKNGASSCYNGFNFYRNSLVLLNIIYIAVACALIGLAAFGKSSAFIVDFSLFGGIIACGVFLLVIALVGLVATMMHHQVTLFFYMMVLVLLFIVQLSIACACLAISPSTQKQLFDIAWAGSSPAVRKKVQNDFDCCAILSTAAAALLNDSLIKESISNTTDSCGLVEDLTCCKNSSASCCTGQSTGDATCPCMDCWDAISQDISYALRAAGVVGLLFSFTEIFGVWLAFRFRNQKNPNANPNDFL